MKAAYIIIAVLVALLLAVLFIPQKEVCTVIDHVEGTIETNAYHWYQLGYWEKDRGACQALQDEIDGKPVDVE